MFQSEFKSFLALSLPIKHESDTLCEYVVADEKHERSWKVSFNRAFTSIACSCRKFDTFGILCSHALKVFEFNDVKVIPEKYILGRWTRDARCGIVQDFRGKEVEGDPKLARNRMFRQVVSKFIRTATEASYSKESLESLDNGVDVLFKKVMEDRGKAIKKVGDNNDHPTVVSSDVMQPKGFRTRPGSKRRTKRHKSFLEQQSKKKTLAPKRTPPQGTSSQDMVDGVSCSAPPTYESLLAREDQLSYTSMLMAPFDDTNFGALF